MYVYLVMVLFGCRVGKMLTLRIIDSFRRNEAR